MQCLYIAAGSVSQSGLRFLFQSFVLLLLILDPQLVWPVRG